jgi:ABC-2 type transport system permease protein
MRQILSLLRQDVTNSLRDNVILYMIVAPILLALGARALLPSLEEIKITFAVDTAVDEPIIERLDAFGDVELHDSREAVVARVERADDVPGIVPDGDGYAVILEGNEPEGEEIASVVMSSILSDDALATYEHSQLTENRSLVAEYGAITLVMMAVMLGAVIAGFIMVDEKESGAIQALAVSPLTMRQFTLARAIFALVVSTFMAMVSSAILVGTAVHYGLLLLGCVIGAGVGTLVGYIIGGFSSNQLEAMALIKVLMIVYLTLPFVTIFIPRNWHWPFYPLPNYWMWQIFENLYIGQLGPVGFWGASGLTVALSAVGLLILRPFLMQRLKLR